MRNIWQNKSEMLSYCILAFFLLVPFFLFGKEGFPVGHDLQLELVRISEYQHALFTEGYPRHAYNLYYGYGSPIFVFYPPLFLFLASIFLGVFSDHMLGVKVLTFLLGLLGSFSMYAFLRRQYTWHASFFGALLFSILPYRYIDLYSRNAFAEYTAFMLLPLVLLLQYDFYAKLTKGKLLLYVFGISLFALSHNVTLLLGIPLLCFFAFYWCFIEKRGEGGLLRRLLHVLGPLVLGLGIASFFLLPAFMDGKGWIRYVDLTTRKFALEGNFLSLGEVLFKSDSFIYFSLWIFIPLLISCLIILFPKLRKNFVERKEGVLLLLLNIGFFILLFPISQGIWGVFSIFSMVQFPWRILVFFSVFGVWYIAMLWDTLATYISQKILWGAGGVILGILLIMHIQHYKDWDMHDRNIPSPSKIALENLRTTVGDEYFPVHGEVFPEGLSEMYGYRIREGYYKCLDMSTYSKVTLPLLNFPYWNLRVDEKPWSILSGDALLSFHLPEGRHCVRLILGYTPMQKMGMSTSICFLLLLGGICMIRKKR